MNNYTAQKLRPPVSYYGGKVHLCRRILQMFSPHTTYVESFAGGLSVLLNKFRSEVEVVCDVNPELINFYYTLVSTPELVIDRVKQIKFDRSVFSEAKVANNQGDELTRAVNFLIRQHMSYAGIGKTWAEDKGRAWTSEGKLGLHRKISTWEKLPYDLGLAAKRLQGVKIVLGNALEIIPQYDSSETLFYLDPTYYSPTRVSSKMYAYEMGELDHLRLLRLIRGLQGRVILSGYAHFLYDKELADWDRVEIDSLAFSGSQRGNKTERIEVLWVKPE